MVLNASMGKDIALDVDEWMKELIRKLQDAFGERLRFVGLQGSRARGEARGDSDIDAVVVLDRLCFSDLEEYRAVVGTLPHADIACGFIGSTDILVNWSRYDVFNLVMDTKPLLGTLDFIDTNFTPDDARQAAKAGACEIYHVLGHTVAFEPEHLSQVTEACLKSSFFVMRALRFARTGDYPASRAQMRAVASSDEVSFLDAYDMREDFDAVALSRNLFDWASGVIEST